MKQKVVIRVPMEDAKKRSKAMKVVVGVSGVMSAAIEGEDKNQIVVIGEAVDSVILTTLLRKNVGFADLVSVEAVKEKKDEKKEETKPSEATVQPMVVWQSNWDAAPPRYLVVNDHDQDPSCCIM